MGLFDLFKSKDATPKGKSPKEMARLTRMVSSKLSQDYDRQEAIATLAAMANAEGAKALLRRFDFSMEPSIRDRDEKESAAAGIVETGEAALPAVRAYCGTAESLAWPLKVLRQIVQVEQFVDELLELLELHDTEYVRNTEPKIQLLNVLEEHPNEDVRLATEQFLLDVNEGVRFHAAGTVFAMKNAASVEPMLAAMEPEESLRVKNRLARGLADSAWKIPGSLGERLQAALPSGYILTDGHVAQRTS